MVCVAIGIQPRKELAVASGLKVDRSILVNEILQTSEADVYAAGDVAQVFDPYTGKYLLDSLWGPARLMGRAAGMTMSGTTTPYLKKMSFNVTRLAGITTTIIGMVGGGKDADMVGIARGDSEIWRQQPDALAVQDTCDINRVRLLAGEGSLQGALIMGDQVLSRPLQDLILNQVDISSIRGKLMQPAAPLGDLITNLWKKWEGEHAAQQS
jgi:NAD(P)H-nitrite reductase large subunit